MPNLNRVTLMGRIGADPQVRYMPDGTAVANLRMATSRSWKDKTSGERKEDTEWHSIVMYARQAEIIKEYVHKGSPLYVEGRLRTRKWTDKDGADRYTTEIVGDSLQLLGGKDDAGRGNGNGGGNGGSHARQGTAPDRGRDPGTDTQAGNEGGSFGDLDDDIPF